MSVSTPGQVYIPFATSWTQKDLGPTFSNLSSLIISCWEGEKERLESTNERLAVFQQARVYIYFILFWAAYCLPGFY